MTQHGFAVRCEELYAVGGFEKVRAVAGEGLAAVGPDPVLYRWLGLAHAAEDEDDHDTEAERAYEAGLDRWPDDLGLLVSYLELCLRADGWSYPWRERRAGSLKERIAELAPPGSPEHARVEAAVGWAGRGYWQDLRAQAHEGLERNSARAALMDDVADAMQRGGPAAAHPEDLRAAEVAASLELLAGPRNAPLRLLVRHRVLAYVAAFVLVFVTNRVLVDTGTVAFSMWGWLWYAPLLLAESRLRRARQLARQRVIASVEARHTG